MVYKVTASREGYYAGLVHKPGDDFEITDAAHFSEKWMTSTDLDLVAHLTATANAAAAPPKKAPRK